MSQLGSTLRGRGSALCSAALVGALLGLGQVGCATTATSEGESDSPDSTAFGVVHVEGTTTQDGSKVSVSAKFLRVNVEDVEAAEEAVGTRIVLPTMGQCVPINSLSKPAAEAHLKSPVELVDVGDLSLQARSLDPHGSDRTSDARMIDGKLEAETKNEKVEFTLTPRAFPDIGDLVSGVVYTEPDLGSAHDKAAHDKAPEGIPGFSGELPAPGDYVLTATGASVVEPFTLETEAPATPANVRLAGQRLDSEDGKAPVLIFDKEWMIEWDAVAAQVEGADADRNLVYLDLQGENAVRCAFPDTGSATVPAGAFSRRDVDASVVIGLHRFRESHLKIDLVEREGQESATVRFDFARFGRASVAASK